MTDLATDTVALQDANVTFRTEGKYSTRTTVDWRPFGIFETREKAAASLADIWAHPPGREYRIVKVTVTEEVV